ncbi:uncharacterized protein VNE69_12081 [Vairimorpha necatrix]|uniref:Uncharacterized protein n=1 Tax=Vairimorpha necatrix TaxID=6039 RepID=A0AAX4JGN7_9MICR
MYNPSYFNLPSFSSFRVLNIPVSCDDFYATSKYILILVNNTIKIYSHSECSNIRLYKVIRHNLLLFINKKCMMNILYKILLSNMKNIEDIILYLKVDEIRKVVEMEHGFLVTYKNREKIFYDCNLEIQEKTNSKPVDILKINTIIKNKDKIIQIKRDEIIIGEKTVECKKILKLVGEGNYIFIRNKDIIKALIFTQ